MSKKENKSKAEELLSYAAERISKKNREIDIINKEPDEIAIALLLLPSADEAIEILKAVHHADNIEESQIKGVREELFRLRERIQMLLKGMGVNSTKSV